MCSWIVSAWCSQHLLKLMGAYRKAPHFEWATDTVGTYLRFGESRYLVDIQQHLLAPLSPRFSLAPDLCWRPTFSKPSRELGLGEYVVELVKGVGADLYLTGQGEGSRRTVDADLFAANHIELEYQDYRIPVYPQLASPAFLDTVSIVDALFMVGPEAGQVFCGSMR